MTAIYPFKRGQTIIIDIEDMDGEYRPDIVVTSHMRASDDVSPHESEPVAAVGEVSWHPVTNATTGFWRIVIDAPQCRALSKESYALDAAFEVDGVVFYADSVLIRISEPPTVLPEPEE